MRRITLLVLSFLIISSILHPSYGFKKWKKKLGYGFKFPKPGKACCQPPPYMPCNTCQPVYRPPPPPPRPCCQPVRSVNCLSLMMSSLLHNKTNCSKRLDKLLPQVTFVLTLSFHSFCLLICYPKFMTTNGSECVGLNPFVVLEEDMAMEVVMEVEEGMERSKSLP